MSGDSDKESEITNNGICASSTITRRCLDRHEIARAFQMVRLLRPRKEFLPHIISVVSSKQEPHPVESPAEQYQFMKSGLVMLIEESG
jgi:hypothetical protein